jgi:hypothetical protein
MAQKANLVVDQGSTFSTEITVATDGGSLLDLTGYTGAAQMRRHYSSTNSVSFAVTLGGTDGTVQLSLTSNQTTNLAAARYVYDVELTDGSGNISRILEGYITVSPNVTRV